jgi:BirA family biotin operon repressor/biotin-[acetyl-CoA-carboxylase] ligase
MPDIPTLPSPQDLLAQLQARLPGFGQLAWVETTGSTNADLLARVREQAGARPWLLGAHLQQTGRGRAGRPWQNRPGEALMFSCAFDTTMPAAMLPALSPLAGLVACEALRGLAGGLAGASTAGSFSGSSTGPSSGPSTGSPTGSSSGPSTGPSIGSVGSSPGPADELRVKWPNDLQFGEAKLAGILVETTRNFSGASNSHTVVIGMGMNLTDGARLSRELGRDVADWGAVASETPLADVVAAVALAWQRALKDVRDSGFQAFIARFQRVDALAGRDVNVLDHGNVLQSGIASGTDAHGRLILQTSTARIPVSVGEISVRIA